MENKFITDHDTEHMEDSKEGVAFLLAKLREIDALSIDDWSKFEQKFKSF